MGSHMGSWGGDHKSASFKEKKEALIKQQKSEAKVEEKSEKNDETISKAEQEYLESLNYKKFGDDKQAAYEEAQKFFYDDKNSNQSKWLNSLTESEQNFIAKYTGSSYGKLNDHLYTKKWDDMSVEEKTFASNVYEGINKYELHSPIQVTRATDGKIFGLPEKQSYTVDEIKNAILGFKDNTTQSNGFMSAGVNNKGAEIEASSVRLHINVPPSKGAGAYVNPISWHSGSWENEFLFNSNAQIKWNTSSISYHHGVIHVVGTWVGQGKDQTFKEKKK